MDKRVRSSNFTKEEELALLQQIAKFRGIIECKTTNKISNKDKDEAWHKVLQAHNAINLQARTVNQIKIKYDNLKCRATKEVAKQKIYLRGTGGGLSIKNELDRVTEATLNIINMKTVVGFPSLFDSDVCSNVSNLMCKENCIKPFEEVQAFEEDRNENNPPHFEPNKKIKLSVFNNDKENSPSASQEPLMELSKDIALHQYPLKTTPLAEYNWGQYVPNKLKEKEKLRPTTLNPVFKAKEEYYKRKRELLEETMEEERRVREKRMEREEETMDRKKSNGKKNGKGRRGTYKKKCYC